MLIFLTCDSFLRVRCHALAVLARFIFLPPLWPPMADRLPDLDMAGVDAAPAPPRLSDLTGECCGCRRELPSVSGPAPPAALDPTAPAMALSSAFASPSSVLDMSVARRARPSSGNRSPAAWREPLRPSLAAPLATPRYTEPSHPRPTLIICKLFPKSRITTGNTSRGRKQAAATVPAVETRYRLTNRRRCQPEAPEETHGGAHSGPVLHKKRSSRAAQRGPAAGSHAHAR